MMYFYIIRNFGDAAAPANQNIWSLKGLAIVQVAVILLVQSMYLLRIWKCESRLLFFSCSSLIRRVVSRSIVTNTKISSALLVSACHIWCERMLIPSQQAALVVISLLAFGIGITFVFEMYAFNIRSFIPKIDTKLSGQLEEDISIASFRVRPFLMGNQCCTYICFSGLSFSLLA